MNTIAVVGPYQKDCSLVPSHTLSHYFSLNNLLPKWSVQVQALGQRLKDKISPPSALTKAVRALSAESDLGLKYSDAVQDTLIKAFGSKEYKQLVPEISIIFKKLSDDQLNGLLKDLFLIQGMPEPAALVRKLKTLFSLQKIHEIIRLEFPQFTSIQDVVADVKACELEKRESKKMESRQNLLRMASLYLRNGLEFLFNIVIYILHLKEFLIGEQYYSGDAYMQDTRYRAFRDSMTMMGGWLLALGVYTGSYFLGSLATVGVIMTGGLVGYAYYKYLRPCPDKLNPCKNLTLEALHGKIASVHGRDKEIQDLIDALCANNETTRRHPILLGQTRIGKTEIIKGLALRIASGNVPDALKGKKLFSVNTADMIYYGALEKVQNAIKGHEKDCIFFFDEIHVAFRDLKNRSLVDKFKTLMDPSSHSFKYCIFATTFKDFDKYFDDDALLARLCQFKIDPLKDEQIPQVLGELAEREAADLIISQKALDEVAAIRTLYPEQYGSCSQPAASKLILSQAIAKARNFKSSEKEQQLQVLKDERSACKFQLKNLEEGAGFIFSKEGKKRVERIKELNGQIKELEKAIVLEKNDLSKFFALIRKRSKLKHQLEIKAVNLSKLKLSEEALKEFILEYYFVQRAYNETIDKYSKRFSQSVVTPELIKKIIADEPLKVQAVVKPKVEEKKCLCTHV